MATPVRRQASAKGCTATYTGAGAAREALGKSVTGLTRERARYIDQRLVRGDAAQALLDTVGANPANLIVVGNRGLGATQGSSWDRFQLPL
ncbi:MAG TPA: universal stress protein [Propionibacteriaceae bacterium]|nr:universal stress protein [Propionibacteriaceae bacterium]